MGFGFSKEKRDPWRDIDLEELTQRIKALEENPHRDNLEERLKSLESKADLDNDGIVTRQEMETYMATQLKMREDELIRLNQENEALKESLNKADQRYESLLDQVRKGDTACIQSSKVSNAAIERQIQEWLKDPHTNFSFIPDRAETFAYKKMLAAMLGGMEKVFESFALEFIGHRLQITMQPMILEDYPEDSEGSQL